MPADSTVHPGLSRPRLPTLKTNLFCLLSASCLCRACRLSRTSAGWSTSVRLMTIGRHHGSRACLDIADFFLDRFRRQQLSRYVVCLIIVRYKLHSTYFVTYLKALNCTYLKISKRFSFKAVPKISTFTVEEALK